jgi:hypothetical protein
MSWRSDRREVRVRRWLDGISFRARVVLTILVVVGTILIIVWSDHDLANALGEMARNFGQVPD